MWSWIERFECVRLFRSRNDSACIAGRVVGCLRFTFHCKSLNAAGITKHCSMHSASFVNTVNWLIFANAREMITAYRLVISTYSYMQELLIMYIWVHAHRTHVNDHRRTEWKWVILFLQRMQGIVSSLSTIISKLYDFFRFECWLFYVRRFLFIRIQFDHKVLGNFTEFFVHPKIAYWRTYMKNKTYEYGSVWLCEWM